MSIRYLLIILRILDQKFLEFLYKNLKLNTTGTYVKQFPYLSLCGREKNFIGCEDLPFVITNLNNKKNILYVNNVETLNCLFDPKLIYVHHNGRFYYPLTGKLATFPTSIALFKSSVSIELFESIREDRLKEKFFTYKAQSYKLHELVDHCKIMKNLVETYSCLKDLSV